MGNKLTILVPSKAQESQRFFLRRSVSSIHNQVLNGQFEVDIAIAVDKGEVLDPEFCAELGVRCIESIGKRQTVALNTAIAQLDCDYVAFLEDDDRWQPHFLEVAARALHVGDFVSSNQVIFDGHGNITGFFDFPTPSGWIMTHATMARIGGFNESMRYHIDNDWLGRLNQTDIRRVHLIERNVPMDLAVLEQDRPELVQILNATNNRCTLIRHRFPYPLVQRYTHPNSGMAEIGLSDEFKSISQAEYRQLTEQFGCIPY